MLCLGRRGGKNRPSKVPEKSCNPNFLHYMTDISPPKISSSSCGGVRCHFPGTTAELSSEGGRCWPGDLRVGRHLHMVGGEEGRDGLVGWRTGTSKAGEAKGKGG